MQRRLLRTARWVVAVAIGLTVFGGLSGAGAASTTTLPEDSAAARAVRALDDPQPADDAVPAGFAHRLGYRPVVVGSGSAAGLGRGDGSCSSPLGGTSWGFTDACRQHDLGYDLLRYADRQGRPLGRWARAEIDTLFARRVHALCSTPTCHATAEVYVVAVRLNSVRQSEGVPRVESGGRWALAGGCGLASVLLLGTTSLAGRRIRGAR